MDALGWPLWQWLDSAFPSGAFAHSLGLEAWDHYAPSQLAPAPTLHLLVHSTLQLHAPFVAEAHRKDALADHQALLSVHHALDAHLWGAVQRRASLSQGKALLEATVRSCAADHPAQQARSWPLPPHHAVAFGALSRAFGAHEDQALQGFAFCTARAAVSAAVRLNLMGPFAGQQLLAALQSTAASALAELGAPASASPYLDLIAEQHDRLHTRLFSS